MVIKINWLLAHDEELLFCPEFNCFLPFAGNNLKLKQVEMLYFHQLVSKKSLLFLAFYAKRKVEAIETLEKDKGFSLLGSSIALPLSYYAISSDQQEVKGIGKVTVVVVVKWFNEQISNPWLLSKPKKPGTFVPPISLVKKPGEIYGIRKDNPRVQHLYGQPRVQQLYAQAVSVLALVMLVRELLKDPSLSEEERRNLKRLLAFLLGYFPFLWMYMIYVIPSHGSFLAKFTNFGKPYPYLIISSCIALLIFLYRERILDLIHQIYKRSYLKFIIRKKIKGLPDPANLIGKEIALIPGKQIALILTEHNKQLALIPEKQVATVPNHLDKQVALRPKPLLEPSSFTFGDAEVLIGKDLIVVKDPQLDPEFVKKILEVFNQRFDPSFEELLKFNPEDHY